VYLAKLRTLNLARSEKLNAVVDEHVVILRAIKTVSLKRAVTPMAKYISASISRLDEIITARPNLIG
jgi:DNA-binding GntR family transcriptional regulator